MIVICRVRLLVFTLGSKVRVKVGKILIEHFEVSNRDRRIPRGQYGRSRGIDYNYGQYWTMVVVVKIPLVSASLAVDWIHIFTLSSLPTFIITL